MSAPNKSYDPVQVTALSADAVAAAVTAALAAIAAAADLDALKQARRRARRRPLAAGAGQPGDRRAAPAREGRSRPAGRRRPGGHPRRLEARRLELEAERDARVLVEETVDVTLPWDRRRAAPGTR